MKPTLQQVVLNWFLDNLYVYIMFDVEKYIYI